MKKFIKKFVIMMFVLGMGFCGSSITSKAVEVTKTVQPYVGVVSLTRYTSNGVTKVKNGSPISCKVTARYYLFMTYNALSKSVSLASNQQSYTLNTSGYLTELDYDDPKPEYITVNIAGFK